MCGGISLHNNHTEFFIQIYSTGSIDNIQIAYFHLKFLSIGGEVNLLIKLFDHDLTSSKTLYKSYSKPFTMEYQEYISIQLLYH
jgi:hypothetical protein